MITSLLIVLGTMILTIGVGILILKTPRSAGAPGITGPMVGLDLVVRRTSRRYETVVSAASPERGQADIVVTPPVSGSILNLRSILALMALAAGLVIHPRIIRCAAPWKIEHLVVHLKNDI